MKVAVIGAGVSGLAFAKYASIYRQELDVHIFESESSIGGIAKVKMIGNIPFHMVGGHCFNSKFQDVKDFVFNDVLPESEWNKIERKASILLDGYKVHYPIEYSIKEIYHHDPQLAANIIIDFLAEPESKSDNLGDWFINNFGRVLSEKYFIPYNKKIWNRDPFTMSFEWVSDKLPMPNKNEFVKGLFESAKDVMPHSSFYYPKAGTQNKFIDCLSEDLNIRLNTKISNISIDKISNKILLNGECFDKLVYTAPLDEVVNIINGMPEHVKNAANNLKFNKVTTMIWESEQTEDTWTYVPDPKILFHRMIHIGKFINSEQNYTITETVGERSYEDMIKSGQQISMLLKPIDYNVSNRAYVVFDKNIADHKNTIFSELKESGIHVLGRFGEWEYYNMDICIKQAQELVKSI